MRYAVISDIHGNVKAFEAILDYLEDKNIDELLFLGDYYADLHYPNEVVDLMRSLSNSKAIAGNKEDYLEEIDKTKELWKHQQFNALYWNYETLTDSNREYLIHLPKKICFTCKETNKKIVMVHSWRDIVGKTNLCLLSSSKFLKAYNDQVFTHDEYLEYVNEILNSDEELKNGLVEEKADVYIFGHSHVQWYAKIDNMTLVNGGSCGLPLDKERDAAVTIVETRADDIRVSEYRVPYDVDSLINDYKKSQLYQCATSWAELIIHQLVYAEDNIHNFFQHVWQVAKKEQDEQWPISDKLWESACDSYLCLSKY